MAAAEAARTFPYEGVASHIAREALETHLQGCEACQLEAFEEALALAVEQVRVAFRAQDGWVDRVRGGLVALLEFFDEEPAVARYLVVHSAQAGEAVLARRREILERIALVLDDERAPARAYPPPLAAQAVASGVLGVLYARLSQPEAGSLVELAGSLMSFTVLPFLGARAARRELARPAPSRPAASPQATETASVLKDAAGRLNPRAASVLLVIGADPGLNNRGVARRAGVRDEGQISRVLARLQRLGLIENISHDEAATAKAWQLTTSGTVIEAAVAREAAGTGLDCSFDLPQEFLGRLDDRAVVLLRVIRDQPWLSAGEVAERVGIERDSEFARSLQHLLDLGLAASELEAHRRGTPKVWRLTAAGEQLDNAIGREIPAPPRSVALELMHESGGRLGDTQVSVLRSIGVEPGLSNNDLAVRVGIADENSMSQLLARLSRRGLVENIRSAGRENVWQLTPEGERLERAVWHEMPAAVQRTLALDFVRDRGGRLNHRVVAVLRVIEAEPELSNQEISERVGIDAKGHASTLLARLARFGLIENLTVDPAPFQANAWRLTKTGKELAAATREGGPPVAGLRPVPRPSHNSVDAERRASFPRTRTAR